MNMWHSCAIKSDITLALTEGCLEAWRNCQDVQIGWPNDLSLLYLYKSLLFSSVNGRAILTACTSLSASTWQSMVMSQMNNHWLPPHFQTPTYKAFMGQSSAHLDEKKNRYNMFPVSLLGRKSISLLLWFLKCILFSSQGNVSQNRSGNTTLSFLSLGVEILFFFFFGTVSFIH